MTARPSNPRMSRISGALVRSIVGELNPDTPTTRILRRYGKHSISHGVEHGNDFTDRVVTRRDCYSLLFEFVTTLVKSTLLKMPILDVNRTVMEVMVEFRCLHGSILSNVPLVSKPWISME